MGEEGLIFVQTANFIPNLVVTTAKLPPNLAIWRNFIFYNG
jgi:hypothetical protein